MADDISSSTQKHILFFHFVIPGPVLPQMSPEMLSSVGLRTTKLWSPEPWPHSLLLITSLHAYHHRCCPWSSWLKGPRTVQLVWDPHTALGTQTFLAISSRPHSCPFLSSLFLPALPAYPRGVELWMDACCSFLTDPRVACQCAFIPGLQGSEVLLS
jgi:hypothetical protein